MSVTLARSTIIEHYGSYANACRIHYLLKEHGWFSYGKPLIIELSGDMSNSYIAVKKLFADEEPIKIGKPDREDNVNKYLVYSEEHVDKENETTYFYRPSNLY